jgi:RNA polymerase sigma-70 factor (ECF subfamily)
VSSQIATQLAATSSGDLSAFADLYETVGPRIYRLSFRILRDAHQSEDVTQEVFLEVWRNSDRFDPARGSALSWLMTMTHHKAVDRVRSSEARHRRDTTHAELSRTTPFDETVAAAHAALDAQRVRAALGALTPLQRQALELTYLDGYTNGEVSRLLQIPLGTTKSRIRDGLKRLRDTMPPLAEPVLARTNQAWS